MKKHRKMRNNLARLGVAFTVALGLIAPMTVASADPDPNGGETATEETVAEETPTPENPNPAEETTSESPKEDPSPSNSKAPDKNSDLYRSILEREAATTSKIKDEVEKAPPIVPFAAGRWSYFGAPPHSYFAGAHHFDNFRIVGWCTKDSQPGPVGAKLPTLQYTNISRINYGTDYIADASTASGTLKNQRVPGAEIGKLAWLAQRGQKILQTQGENANVHEIMAIHAAMNSLSTGGMLTAQQKMPPAILDRVNVLLGQASMYAGPYTAHIKMDLPRGKTEGDIVNIGLKSKSGNWVPGQEWKITLNGPAIFPGNNSKIARGNSKSSPTSLKFKTTGSGDVFAKIEFPNLVGTSVDVYRHPKAQDLFVYGGNDSASNVTSTHPAMKEMSVKLSTKVKKKELKDGDNLIDVVTASSDDWQKVNGKYIPVNVRVNVYGPYRTPNKDDRSKLFGTELITFYGPQTKETVGDYPVEANGFYTFVAKVKKEDQLKEYRDIINVTESPFFEPSETAINKWEPKITSEARAVRKENGDTVIYDKIKQAGFPDKHGEFKGDETWKADVGTVTHKVFFAPRGTKITNGMSAKMTPEFTAKTLAKNGTFEIGPFTMDRKKFEGGTYFVVSEFSGDGRVKSITTPETDRKEQVNKPPSAVTTKLLHSGKGELEAGGQIWDQITLTGGYPKGSYTDVFLYRWDKNSSPVCNTPIANFKINHDGNPGSYVTKRYTTDDSKAYAYGFVEHTMVKDGNKVREVSKGVCGDPAESIVATEPDGEVRTQLETKDGSTEAGIEIRDHVILENDLPKDSYTVVELYRWEKDTDPVCTAPIHTFDRIDHAGVAGEYVTDWFKTERTETWTYGMVEKTYYRDGSLYSSGECGEPDETVDIDKPDGKVRTQLETKDGSTEAGVEIRDNVFVEGKAPTGSYTVVELYRWKVGDPAVCEVPIHTFDPIEHNGDSGAYQTSWFKTERSETWTYGMVEKTYYDDGVLYSSGECGEPDETVEIEKPDGKVRTKLETKDGSTEAGVEIRDNVTLDGKTPTGSYTVVELYRWEIGQPAKCETPIHKFDPIKHNGEPGSYHTAWFETEKSKSWTYGMVEKTYYDDGELYSSGECGEPDETVTLNKRSESSGGSSMANTGADGTLIVGGFAAGLLALGGVALGLKRRKN